MALTGVFITFGITSTGSYDQPPTNAILLGPAVSSQLMASPATASIIAPGSVGAKPVCSISASAPIYYSLGPNPNPTSGTARYLDPSFGREDVFCNAGDEFAWIFA